jgi:hypothetical protein
MSLHWRLCQWTQGFHGRLAEQRCWAAVPWRRALDAWRARATRPETRPQALEGLCDLLMTFA